MPNLFLNGRYFDYENIKSQSYLNTELTDYELLALNFCADWLNGKTEFVIQTSGSTGAPKTIHLNQAKMQASAHATVQTLDLQPNTRALVCLNVAYIGGMMMLVRGLEFGFQMTIIPPSSNPFIDLRNKFSLPENALNFDFISLVPLQMQTILTETPQFIPFLDSAKAIIIGGAAVSYALQTQLQILKSPVYSTYGMTETVSHIALQKLNGIDKQTYFQVLQGIEIQTDARNCLQIKAQVTDDKWLITNDLVELISESKFRWLGRADNVINSGGVKIQVEAVEKVIEQVFYELNLPNAFFVAGLADEKLGQKLALIIEGEGFSEIMQEKLEKLLIKSLKKYEIPKKIIYFEVFNRTNTDKINRIVTLQNVKD
jgi:o-succinylbenzoate---CoA ligase